MDSDDDDDERPCNGTTTYLDIVKDCDSFPYNDPLKPEINHYSKFYSFYLPLNSGPHGFLLPETVEKMPWTPSFIVDHEQKIVELLPQTLEFSLACTSVLSRLIQKAIDKDVFKIIHGKHSEPYPIIGANFPVSIERFAAPLFGIISRGAHLTAYTRTEDGLRIHVPRRSWKLFTYPGDLDSTVAGGVAAGETLLECIIREAEEEATLPADFVRENIKAVGCISYITNKDAHKSEQGLFSPEIIYCYDLELPEKRLCKPGDDEVQEFYEMSVYALKDALINKAFKPNSACVMIDFLIRHGLMTSNDRRMGDYTEILARLHRKMPFATVPDNWFGMNSQLAALSDWHG